MKHNVPIPNISADAWCVFDMDSGGNFLIGKRAENKREIASLTKMMTFYVAWSQFQQNFPEKTSLSILIPGYCTHILGTTARLKKKDTLTLEQLFYAMLLPSGNDAALVLADYFGGVIAQKQPGVVPPKSFQF